MAVLSYSRHRFSFRYTDSEGRFFLDRRPKFYYVNLPDNRTHTVVEGDTLHSLAAKYFASFADPKDPTFSPAQLFWVIADFQVPPIHDTTLALTPGSTLVIPSNRTVEERIFGPLRNRRV